MPLWRRWQSLLAILLFFLNVDYVIMPALQWVWKMDGWPLFWCAVLAATAEVVYWNEYAKWLVRHVKRSGPVRRTARAFASDGLQDDFERLVESVRGFGADSWDWFVEHARSHTDADSPGKQRVLQGVLGVIKNTHIWMAYPMMLGLGLCPFGWAVGIVVQRVVQAPGAFLVFLAANAMKTYLLGLLYLLLPWWIRVSTVLTVISVVLWKIRTLSQKGPSS